MGTGFIDHIGIAVDDLDAAAAYYDNLMSIVGFTPWFPADEHQRNYGPVGGTGTQIFLYRSDVSLQRSDSGRLQHVAFGVPDRSTVIRAHDFAAARGDEIVHRPRPFPEYGEHCFATFFLDPHGIRLEVVTHSPT